MDKKNTLKYLYELFNLATNYSKTGVCVIDAITREIYFCNNVIFSLAKEKQIDYQGMSCHKALFNRIEPCDDCPLKQTRLGKEEHVIHIKDKGLTYQVKSKIVHWEGKELLIDFLTDISDDLKQLDIVKQENEIKKNNFDLAKTKTINDTDLISYIIFDLTNDCFVSTATGKYCDLTKYRDCSALPIFANDISEIIIDLKSRKEFIDVHNRSDLLKRYYSGDKEIQFDIEVKLANGQDRWERIELIMAENPENGSVYLFEYAYDINIEKNVEIMMDFAVNDEYDLIGNVNLKTKDCVMMYGENSYNVFGKKVVEDDYDVSLERFIKNGVLEEYQESYRKLASLDTVKENLKNKSVYEIVFHTKYGNENRVKRDRYSLYGPDSNYCLFTQTDITDVLALEEQKRVELQVALNNANAATKAKSVFLSKMSHEIRTPLNAIIGINELVKDDLNKGKFNKNTFLEYNNDISSSSKYLLSILNDILDTSKIESGKMEIIPYQVNLEQFIGNINVLAKSLAEERSIEFNIHIIGNNRKLYQFDGLHVEQIIMNLLGNAFKFTSPGGNVDLEVKIIENNEAYSTIQFIVSDDGIGMSKEFQKEMFNSFTQEHTEHTSKYGGSGLGLNLVHELVQMMHGAIDVESEKGKGTKFTVTIDIENNSVKDSENESNLLPPKIDELDLKGLRILLCEDHVMNQKITRTLLERKNAKVDVASDGIAGLNAFSKSQLDYYQLIIMDIRMPNMDGIEAAKKIRALNRKDAKSIPIIALSANAYDEDIQESKGVGMNAHLSKPIEPYILFTTISSLVK